MHVEAERGKATDSAVVQDGHARAVSKEDCEAMRISPLSRLIAVALLCVPLAWLYSSHAQRNLDQINSDPAGYLQHAKSLQHPSFLHWFFLLLFVLAAIVFIIEGLAHLVGRFLPERRERSGDGGDRT